MIETRTSPFGSSRGRDMLMAPNLGPTNQTATGIRQWLIGNHPKHPASRMTSGQFLERR
jgi:hypothetical protein